MAKISRGHKAFNTAAGKSFHALDFEKALAISPAKSDEYSNAQPTLDPESVKRFCQVWAGVGRAILARREQ